MSDKQCPCCHRNNVGPIKARRRNTQYVDEQSNYIVSCVHCIAEDDVEFAYMWADYYNSSGVGCYAHYTDYLINRTPWRNVW